MAGFGHIRCWVDAQLDGQRTSGTIRKVPSQATTAGWWADVSMAAGIPQPNYYASDPLTAAVLSGYRGIYHGGAVSPYHKYLSEIALVSPTAGFIGQFSLLDYLLYYPFLDLDEMAPQDLDNTVTLPRYEDGAGVQAMLVAVAPTLGTGSFTFTYINQDGTERVSPTCYFTNAAANIATLLTSNPGVVNRGFGPFLPLPAGDTGIRRVTQFTVLVANGGLASLVLVKPLAAVALREVNRPAEITYWHMGFNAPRIVDGAYLNFIVNAPATIAAGFLVGRANFVWG